MSAHREVLLSVDKVAPTRRQSPSARRQSPSASACVAPSPKGCGMGAVHCDDSGERGSACSCTCSE